MDFAVFGAGCFWCVEAIFSQLSGVTEVESGYTGGYTNNPTYEEVCKGNTGHVEVCRIIFDPRIISYETLLKVFWEIHDPTTLNSQGNDIGTQYRSAIFYNNEKQKQIAEDYKNILNNKEIFNKSIVTEITKLDKYYVAENYHQNYYQNNLDQQYCKYVIRPKIKKFKEKYNQEK